MKITIEFEGQIVSLYNPEVVTINDALELVERALLASGYCFEGTLDIVDEESNGVDDKDPTD